MHTQPRQPRATSRTFASEIRRELERLTGRTWVFSPVRVYNPDTGAVARVYCSWVEQGNDALPVRLTHYWDAQPSVAQWQIERGDRYATHRIGPYAGWQRTALGRALTRDLIRASAGVPFGRRVEGEIPW